MSGQRRWQGKVFIATSATVSMARSWRSPLTRCGGGTWSGTSSRSPGAASDPARWTPRRLGSLTAPAGACRYPRPHRAVKFTKFLTKIDNEVPEHLDVHLICDNYNPHKSPRS